MLLMSTSLVETYFPSPGPSKSPLGGTKWPESLGVGGAEFGNAGQ